ncbi:hypothetical protein PC116_g5903 [Phytophthora cactorum]|nr:hypothetical protein Pcac1_g3874 [Phytophthora cactorum]KAG4246335.1 hypothetical protein PC116_g5903 [Phytophthora cactorum]
MANFAKQLEGIDTIQCRELQTERNAKIATENAFVFNATVDWLLSSGIVKPLASAQGKPSRINDAKMVALLRGSQKEELLHDRMEGDAQKVSWITTTDRFTNETGLMDSGKPRCTYPGCMQQAQLKGLCRTHGGRRLCSEPGCTKVVNLKGKCIAHGGINICSEFGCVKKATRQVQCSRRSETMP